jgi:hypothetical protein
MLEFFRVEFSAMEVSRMSVMRMVTSSFRGAWLCPKGEAVRARNP